MTSQLPADFTIVIPTYNERDRIEHSAARGCSRPAIAKAWRPK